jgi:hypothetical protein
LPDFISLEMTDSVFIADPMIDLPGEEVEAGEGWVWRSHQWDQAKDKGAGEKGEGGGQIGEEGHHRWPWWLCWRGGLEEARQKKTVWREEGEAKERFNIVEDLRKKC